MPGCFRDHLLKLLYCAGLASTRHLCSDTDRAFGGTGLRMPAPKQARHGSTFLQKLRLVNLAAELAGVVACDAQFSEVVVVVCCFASWVGGVLCIPIFAREGSSPKIPATQKSEDCSKSTQNAPVHPDASVFKERRPVTFL